MIPFLLHIAQQGIKLLLVLQSSQLVEFSLDGATLSFVQLHAVHYDFVQVTDFCATLPASCWVAASSSISPLNLLCGCFLQG